MALTAEYMGIDKVRPEEMGANIVVAGIDDFTKLPFGTVMQFGTTNILLTGQNLPCIIPGQEIQKRVQAEEDVYKFAKAAMGRRGTVGMVLVPGTVSIGDEFEIMITLKVRYPS